MLLVHHDAHVGICARLACKLLLHSHITSRVFDGLIMIDIKVKRSIGLRDDLPGLSKDRLLGNLLWLEASRLLNESLIVHTMPVALEALSECLVVADATAAF